MVFCSRLDFSDFLIANICVTTNYTLAGTPLQGEGAYGCFYKERFNFCSFPCEPVFRQDKISHNG